MPHPREDMKENPGAVLAWIRGELESGKFLVLPPAIYDNCVKLARENGFSEKAIANLHKSSFLPTT